MAYTEIMERNGNKYYYRTISLRNNDKVSKKREYLGKNLDEYTLTKKEKESDIFLAKIRKETKKKRILKKLSAVIIKVLKKYSIRQAGIFGSYAKGEQNKKSDIDILIAPSKPLGFKFARIKIELEKKLRKEVDLLTYNSLNSLIKSKVLNEEVRIL